MRRDIVGLVALITALLVLAQYENLLFPAARSLDNLLSITSAEVIVAIAEVFTGLVLLFTYIGERSDFLLKKNASIIVT
jgi:hypothetical protein